MFDGYAQQLLETVRANQAWAAPFTFVLAFGESLAFLSILVPATVFLIGLGALIATGAIDFWPVWIAAVLGCILGDVVSYIIGWRYKDQALRLWPLNKMPWLGEKSEAFFRRWGIGGLILGKFVGPLRAGLPLAAGIARMEPKVFVITTIVAGMVWAGAWMVPAWITGVAVAG
jgi:membrane protein DedA with SNARE-associated domain